MFVGLSQDRILSEMLSTWVLWFSDAIDLVEMDLPLVGATNACEVEKFATFDN